MNKWLRRILLINQIGGGLIGLMTITNVFSFGRVTATTVVLAIIWAALFCLGIVAGLALVEKPRLGLRLSLIYQAIQVPMLISPLITYAFASGFTIAARLRQGSNLLVNFNFGGQFSLELFQDHPWGFGINLVAAALLIAISLTLRRRSSART